MTSGGEIKSFYFKDKITQRQKPGRRDLIPNVKDEDERWTSDSEADSTPSHTEDDFTSDSE